jgi:hypothetical protein
MPVTTLLHQLPSSHLLSKTINLLTNYNATSYVGCDAWGATLRVEHKVFGNKFHRKVIGHKKDL